MTSMSPLDPSPTRRSLRQPTRLLIKAGTSVITQPNGHPSLTRIGAICEQISNLVATGSEIILVSSGAVGLGKKVIRNQALQSTSIRSAITRPGHHDSPGKLDPRYGGYSAACAAAGQFGLMNIFSTMFEQVDLHASQVLLTQDDFMSSNRLENITSCINNLLDVGIIPIINENDAVSANMGYTDADVFSDNDSLAALCAKSFGCSDLLLLTDVAGVYNRPPSHPEAKLIPFHYDYTDTKGLRKSNSESVIIGEKSTQGRGGMSAKIAAAEASVAPGSSVQACIVASGSDLTAIGDTFGPYAGLPPKGTLFANTASEVFQRAIAEYSREDGDTDARDKARAARDASRRLLSLSYEQRQEILNAVADSLVEPGNVKLIMEANGKDLADAAKNDVDAQLVRRLQLTEAKLSTLATGIRQIASAADPLNVELKDLDVAQDLVLKQVTVPIGVLMIIFESRPDSLPQIVALAIASGNGLLLKGGREANHSNKCLHKIIGDAVEDASNEVVSRDLVGLVTSRNEIKSLLALNDCIDLVIPRGGNALVSYIKSNTKIPVLGHADGVCHCYVDSSADVEKAAKIVVDSKIDYPAACNATETVLLHRSTLNSGVASAVLRALRSAGVQCLGGPRAMVEGLCDVAAKALKCEYGDLRILVEVVDDAEAAVDHIHKYGSGHTECIVAEDKAVAEKFLASIDAACCFHNASTRFADGFRFGMGAEVGISTGRIHARGPCGVESLLTVKWVLRSGGCDTVGEFGRGEKAYTHVVRK